MLQVSAPGKMFLLGEYAVLEGAPALLSAVDRRVQVRITAAAGSHWTISAPDIGIEQLQLEHDGRLPQQLSAATRKLLRVYAAVRTELAAHIDPLAAPLAIHISSGKFSHNGHKLGLGASAAVAAALSGALLRTMGQNCTRDALCRQAIAAHRRAQHDTGSGADVATSVHGGVLEYRAGEPAVELAWPADITGMAVVTGTGASTTQLVARVKAYGKRARQRYIADMAQLQQLAGVARAALADADSFLQLVRAYFAALQELDKNAGAGIVLPAHHELAALAARHGGAFKTCGAGGGDLGLAFACSGEPARRLAGAFTAAGAEIVPLSFAAQGLHYG